MTLLFVACTRCGHIIDDPENLAAAHHNSWNCPACGAANAPLGKGAQQPDLKGKGCRNRDEEIPILADRHGLSGKARPLYFPTAESR